MTAESTGTAALREAYGTSTVQSGQGGSIPLCTVLADHFPAAEIERMAPAEALFLRSCAEAFARSAGNREARGSHDADA
ncbi:hypothetical protein HHL19_20335 [Streptomyces sp. R302]|uniref:hypothetical protein n=1 Tax=unclassified Streptomyces TaxID=2593676 RepID=UPI00145F86A7|nr:MULTISPECIES: hypothetical protein [unclassified Streptomyces]NML50857.1 hypothetical protein [Streptomyces sp. R301]NML80951.1 hypothetical protein [Streptomyces sp. R302]